MKLRNGFVSNSSTTSFVVLGVKVPEDEISRYLPEDMDMDMDPESESIYDYMYDKWTYLESGEFLIGNSICECGDHGLCKSETNITNVAAMAVDIITQYPWLTLDDIKLHTGTRQC